MTAGLAHEIRNPLQFIQNYANVVAELSGELDDVVDESSSDLPPTVLDDLTLLRNELGQAGEHLVRHVARLDAIVESMLAASHHGTVRRQLTNVNVLVRESAELAYYERGGATATGPSEQLLFALADHLPLVVLDPLRVSRAVINLVGNALQAADEGTADGTSPVVRVETEATPSTVDIVVSDNGPGIPAELRDRVFEPFFTGKPGRHHAGLGLTQVWDIIVGDHHGGVTIDAGRPTGTSIRIRIPIDVEDRDETS
jgi:signal transduction histidine kinase